MFVHFLNRSRVLRLCVWTWGIDKFNNEKYKIIISKYRGNYSVAKKEYIDDQNVIEEDGKLKYYEYVYSNTKSIIEYSTSYGSTELTKIIGENRKFNNPKNHEMIKYLLSLHQNKNSVILDFFAGSGTTAQAVLELNKEDGGNRKFILCTNNENGICENVTYPRIKTVITGKRIDNSKYSDGLKGSLRYFKTDFVKNEGTRDQLYYDLTEKCVPMLCVKEGTFDVIIKNEQYAIYTDKDKKKYTCVYFDTFGNKYDEFLDKVEELKNEKVLYIFSLGNKIEEPRLENLQNYKIEAIPQRIYNLFKKIVKLSKEA